MIPQNITEENVLDAIKEIDTKGIRHPLAKSKKFDLIFNNKTYPPKYTISIANEFANKEYLTHRAFNTDEAQNYLKKLSTKFIIQPKESDDPILDLIEKYKKHIRENRLEGEIYKWKLLSDFKGRPDVNAIDFSSEIRSINFSNLIYPVGISAVHQLAKERTELYRDCFKVLFDEEKPLEDRIKFFNEETLKFYRELVPQEKFSHHQDERTMATFLTYHNPDKYTFYKDSFYQKYCKLLEINSKKKGEKYVHYLELVEDFINEYINEDKELIDLVKEIIPPDYFQDVNHKILAQDILYQTLDKLSPGNGVIGLMASDSTGWQDEHIEELSNYDTNIIWNSKRPSGTDETINFLRKIVEENDSFNLYYCSGGFVNYKAIIIDFVENQNELDKKEWNKVHEKIMYYNNRFADYKDNKKKASIVFLAKSLEKINPIPVTEFKFYKSYDVPRQDNLSPIKYEPEIKPIELNDFKIEILNNMNLKNSPLNQILFGPPGTGKTYNTINKALEIIDEKIEGKSRQEIKDLFDIKMNEGQIVFTTFHQSMTYEDFIEGIKPMEPKQEGQQVNYKIIDGIFKKACAIAGYNCYKLFTKSKSPTKYSFDDLYEAFINSIQVLIKNQTPPIYKTLRGRDVEVKEINSNDSIIARAKNSIASSSAPLTKENLQKLYDKFKTIEEIEDLQQVQETVQVTPRITEFYAVFKGLKEFEKNYRPDEQFITETNKVEVLDFNEIQKKFNARVFNEAIKVYGKDAETVVFIIDEINRGNVSQIFGELITLIEEDKRLGNAEALEVILPYSKERFGVPPNLHIIGTMNTADRSVEALDTALRRRFSFEEITPNSGLVATKGKLKNGLMDDIELPLVLDIINKRIEKLLDKDHLIGHSYFMSVSNLRELKEMFQNKIIPLLQEYFFGDFGKIGLVLGGEFFELVENSNENLFADFADYDASEFAERIIYQLKDIQKMQDDDFKKAINTLLKK